MLERTIIPMVPTVIDPALLTNGRLLSPENIKKIQDKLAKQELQPGRISKKTLQDVGIDSSYSVIALDKDQIFVIAPGEKQGMLLGKGSVGKVKVVQDINGDFFALKICKQSSENDKENQTREYDMLTRVEQAIGSVTYSSASKKEKMFAVIMPMAPGVDANKIPLLSVLQSTNVCINIVSSLIELHDKVKLLHLDIKPENIRIDPVTGKVTLIDFSSALTLDASGKAQGILTGTPFYMAFELLDKFVDEYYKKITIPPVEYSAATETYSLGLALAFILKLQTRKTFYHDSDRTFAPYLVAAMNSDIVRRNVTFKDPTIRKEIVELLAKMTSKKPEDRPALSAVATSFQKILEKLNINLAYHLKVALIDVGEFNLLSPIQQRSMINALEYERFDQIQLVVEGKIDKKAAEKVFRKLNDSQLLVRQDVIHGEASGVGLITGAKELSSQQELRISATWVTMRSLNTEEKEKLTSGEVRLIQSVAPSIVQKEKVIRTDVIQLLPPKMDPRDLINGKLLSDNTINSIREAIRNDQIKITGNGGRITKAELEKLGIPAKYNIYALKNADGSYRLFAAYKGQEKALGAGTQGKVKIVQDLDNGKFYAAKTLEQPVGRDVIRQAYIDTEKENLKKAGQWMGELKYQPAKKGSTKPNRDIVIMELGEGASLSKDRMVSLKEIDILNMLDDVLIQLADLHQRKLIHADIKPDNILLSMNKTKLIDLGIAITLEQVGGKFKAFVTGTQNYLPSEFMKNKSGEFSEKTDIYSYAIAMGEVLELVKDGDVNGSKRLVLVDEQDPVFAKNTIIKDPQLRHQLLMWLATMTDTNPERRPTVKEARAVIGTMLQQIAGTPEATKNIAILDLKEWRDANAADRGKLLQDLKTYDEIRLISTDMGMSESEAQRLIKSLSEAKLRVHSTLTHGDESLVQLAQAIPRVESSKHTLLTLTGLQRQDGQQLKKEGIDLHQLGTVSRDKLTSSAFFAKSGVTSVANQTKKTGVDEQEPINISPGYSKNSDSKD